MGKILCKFLGHKTDWLPFVDDAEKVCARCGETVDPFEQPHDEEAATMAMGGGND